MAMINGKKGFYEGVEGLPDMPRFVRQKFGHYDGEGKKFGIVAARFNPELSGALVKAAVDVWIEHGVPKENIEIIWVPGSFEIPLPLQRMAARKEFDALVACGVVIEGDTRHADLIMNALVQSFVRVSLDFDCPVIDAVVSARTVDQAEARCFGGRSSRGGYAALAAMETSTRV